MSETSDADRRATGTTGRLRGSMPAVAPRRSGCDVLVVHATD